MGHDFEIIREVELNATPEQVWEAIATGPGIASWFMGPSEIEPAEGGAITVPNPDGSGEPIVVGTVTTWDPPHRYTTTNPEEADGSFHAFEYLVEGREGGSTVLRFVHSGRTSDDWHDEYEALTGYGWELYLFTLSQYLTYFPGRFATYITANGPAPAAAKDAWPVLERGLGLTSPVETGDKVRLTPGGLPPIEGVVDVVVPGAFLGIRTEDAFYRFHGLAALDMPFAVGHHFFGKVDPVAAVAAWQRFLGGLFPDAEA